MKYEKKPTFFEEIKEIRRFFKTPKKERKIVFYAEHGGYWLTFEGLVSELNGRGGKVFYVTSSWSDPILDSNNSLIEPFYINKLMSFFAQLIDSRVFIMTLSDLNNHYIKKSRHPVHYVYVFHALVSTHMVYNFGAFDYYDSTLCVGPHHIKEIRKQEELYNLKPKKLVEAGYYRLEKIMEEFKNHKGVDRDMNKKTILIAPSWGDQNILETCGFQLAGLLLDKDYNVIVRPHSETVRRYPDLIKTLKKNFGNRSNFKMEKSNATDDSIINADVLISDSSGIAIEYAFGTERPVIFIDVPLKIKNKRYQEMGIEPLELALRHKIGRVVSLKDLESLPIIIESLTENAKQFKEEMSKLREENVFNLGNSSKIGAEYILSLSR